MRNGTFGRRRMLTALGMAAIGAVMPLGGCSQPPRQTRFPSQPSPESSSGPPATPAVRESDMPVLRSEFVFSEHRRAHVELIVSYPSGLATTENLPMVLYLHGRDGVKPTPVPFTTLSGLERGHRDGAIPPFGFVTVDGGYNPYWTDDSPNGDLLSMLRDEVPGWLLERGLGDANGLPFACGGISTGGFGALHYAIERSVQGLPVSAAALLAPALWTSFEPLRERNVFGSEAQWRAADPLRRLDDLGDVPVGIWVGDTDVFVDGSSRVAEQHEDTPVFSVIEGGGHEPSVFEAVGPDMIRFLGDYVPSQD